MGESAIDSLFANVQAAQQAAFAADIAAFNARSAFDLSVQDNEYSRAAKAAAGSQGDPLAELEKIKQALQSAGKLTPEVARKIAQAEKFLGGRNRRKREDCK